MRTNPFAGVSSLAQRAVLLSTMAAQVCSVGRKGDQGTLDLTSGFGQGSPIRFEEQALPITE